MILLLIFTMNDYFQCSERGSRVHESDYPHTYNPNMALVSALSLPFSPSLFICMIQFFFFL